MLPAAHRLHRSGDFAVAVRQGRRARGDGLVVHQLRTAVPDAATPARVGFVVSRAVGPSVVRHRVTRRLRAQLRMRLTVLPAGSITVVRALPEAATNSSQRLGRGVDTALARLDRTAAP